MLVGGSWGGGDHIYIYIYAHVLSLLEDAMMSPVGSHPVESSQVKSPAVNLEANLGGVDTVDGAEIR